MHSKPKINIAILRETAASKLEELITMVESDTREARLTTLRWWKALKDFSPHIGHLAFESIRKLLKVIHLTSRKAHESVSELQERIQSSISTWLHEHSGDIDLDYEIMLEEKHLNENDWCDYGEEVLPMPHNEAFTKDYIPYVGHLLTKNRLLWLVKREWYSLGGRIGKAIYMGALLGHWRSLILC